MNFWQFCSDSPFLAFFMLVVVLGSITSIVKSVWGHCDHQDKEDGDGTL